ncbi:MAG TPA: Gmad2 immunoglobulin-like domain-containing protein [Aggregatilineales bacterium]|nr:Gmad2 immunoglobulin-like domain-containing protein [Aggregatilineales bacterium]
MRRLAVMILPLLLLALPVLACDLSGAAPVPTAAPPPQLDVPVVGLNPISGPPGTVVSVSAAGFPTDAKVNLYISPATGTNPNPVAQNLTIGPGGILKFAMQLPDTLNGTPLATGTTDLTVSISSADGLTRANAVFIAIVGSATAPTPTSASGATGGASSTLFITAPGINSVITGNAIVVTGSGAAFNNQVGVQLQDSSYNVIASALATIQAAKGAVGPWQTTVSVPQPGSAAVAYIVAYTVNASGQVAQQASIPVQLAGSGVPTAAPPTVTGVPPTVPPVITGAPTLSFVTATP